MNEKGKTLISEEPWYSEDPATITEPLKAQWGYLQLFEVSGFSFDSKRRPTNEEIINSNAYISLIGDAHTKAIKSQET